MECAVDLAIRSACDPVIVERRSSVRLRISSPIAPMRHGFPKPRRQSPVIMPSTNMRENAHADAACAAMSLVARARVEHLHNPTKPIARRRSRIVTCNQRSCCSAVDEDSIVQNVMISIRKGIKTIEDLAGCATDDLRGWIEDTVADIFVAD
jgi:hypothetical protein